MKVSHRISELRSFMYTEGIEAAIVSNPDHQYYVSGFKALLYSRPIIYVLDDQHSHLIVPALEELHAKEEAKIDHIHVYFEHPERANEGINPYQHLKTLLKKSLPLH